jgi:hypothetical protein
MNRTLELVIDTGSWAPEPVPVELSARAGERQVDVLAALVFTALWTRPPVIYGFHLSDLWAWHRYLPALATTSGLRLREEWTSIDRHQKTILSDELGVGFTTLLIREAFNCGEFIDTLHFVKVLEPSSLSLLEGARAGSHKSPDYVARLTDSKLLVLECKGTQSSRSALKKAIVRGELQKANLKASDPSIIEHSLVAGLFIPQWHSEEAACVWVSDPSWEDLEVLVNGQTKERVEEAITQVALAQQLTLSGLSALPQHLTSVRVGDLNDLPPQAKREIEALLKEGYRILFDSAELRFRVRAAESTPRVVFSVKPPADLLRQLNESTSVSEVISDIGKEGGPLMWRLVSGDFFAEVTTPTGFSFRLEVEPHNQHLKRTSGAAA